MTAVYSYNNKHVYAIDQNDQHCSVIQSQVISVQ